MVSDKPGAIHFALLSILSIAMPQAVELRHNTLPISRKNSRSVSLKRALAASDTGESWVPGWLPPLINFD